MNREYIQTLLDTRPFVPFTVYMSSGQFHNVRYPGCAILTPTRMVITDPDADHIVVVSLFHIVKVEMLQPAQPAAS